MKSPEFYLDLVKKWEDPNPKPIVEEHQGFYVVRDDLLQYGSKTRFVDYLIGHDPSTNHVKEWVFGSCPATGFAQISLPVVCHKYGKKAVLFMAERAKEKLHPYQKKGLELGADYRWVKMGFLTVTQARARKYAEEDLNTRKVLPLGLEHDTVLGSIIKVARSLPVTPDEIWSVGSSGTLSRGLQLAFPSATVHVVQVGHVMSELELGRAVSHRSVYKFDKPVTKDEMPPYPSAPTYDAKVWQPMINWYKNNEKGKRVLVWNVA